MARQNHSLSRSKPNGCFLQKGGFGSLFTRVSPLFLTHRSVGDDGGRTGRVSHRAGSASPRVRERTGGGDPCLLGNGADRWLSNKRPGSAEEGGRSPNLSPAAGAASPLKRRFRRDAFFSEGYATTGPLKWQAAGFSLAAARVPPTTLAARAIDPARGGFPLASSRERRGQDCCQRHGETSQYVLTCEFSS